MKARNVTFLVGFVVALFLVPRLACRYEEGADLVTCAYNVLGASRFESTQSLALRHMGIALDAGVCKAPLRLGNFGEGGWTACVDALPTAVQGFARGSVAANDAAIDALGKDACIAYSFGIRTDWSFDHACANLGCHVFAYDPSIGRHTGDVTPRIHFFDEGVAGEDMVDTQRNWKLSTVPTLMARNAHPTMDLLKMDVEGFEWASLERALAAPGGLQTAQLMLEVHWEPSNPRVMDGTARRVLTELAAQGFVAFAVRENVAGAWFVPWEVAPPPGTPWNARMRCCYDVSFMRRNA